MDFPQDPASHRILNVHQNVPGVLRDINRIISDLNVNIKAQVRLKSPIMSSIQRTRDTPVPCCTRSHQIMKHVGGLVLGVESTKHPAGCG